MGGKSGKSRLNGYERIAQMMREQSAFERKQREFRDNRFRKAHADGLTSEELGERFGISSNEALNWTNRLGLKANRDSLKTWHSFKNWACPAVNPMGLARGAFVKQPPKPYEPFNGGEK